MDIDNDSVQITASSGSTTANRIRDRKSYSRWSSSGSSDATTETITINPNAQRTIDRLHLIRHNWKAFNVQYWNGSSYVDFSNVVTAEGTQASITETDNAKETSYYEFDAVTTDLVRVQIETTQTVDAEKTLFSMLLTEEEGTFVGYPVFKPFFHVKRISKELLSGRPKFSDLDQAAKFSLTFTRYPPVNDWAILLSLWEGRKEFLFWPCGGDESQFRFELKGTRLEDIFLVQFESDFSPWFDQNVYDMAPNASVTLVEVG